MGHRSGIAAFAAVCLFAAVPLGTAQAMPAQPLALADATPPLLVEVDQGGGFFHHRKKVETAYCLRKNYWWFYRPYTTAPENYPRCEPYFHYLEPRYGDRGARDSAYIK